MTSSESTRRQVDLSRLTVVVPTFNRPDSIRRQSEYWSNRGPRVVILDGSAQPMSEHFVTSLAENIKYIYSATSFARRRATAGQFVNTEFAVLLPDDEFHLESGLWDCIQYLDQHPDVIGCAGKVLGFFVEQGEFRAFLNYEDWLRFPDGCQTINQRLDYALPPRKAHKVECSVIRSRYWKQIFEESYCDEYSCGFVYERLLNLYAAVLGRTELINSVMWMRSLENPPTHSADAPRLGRNTFVSWATSGDFADEVAHYFEKAKRIIGSTGQLSQDEINVYASRFLFGGVERQARKVAKNEKVLSRKIGNWMIRFAPQRIKLMAKRVVPARFLSFTGWRGERKGKVLRSLQERSIAIGLEDLRRVEELALKSAASR